MSLYTSQLALNPLALYHCNETSGSTANDTSGNVNGPYNLTIGSSINKGQVHLTPNDPNSTSFSCSSATVSTANLVTATGVLPAYLSPTTAASTEVVLQLLSTSTGAGCFSTTSNGTIGYEQMMIGTLTGLTLTGTTPAWRLVYSTDGTNAVSVGGHPSMSQSANVYHVVLTFSGGGGPTPTVNFYVNGALVNTATLPSGALLFYPSANTGGPAMFNDSQDAIGNAQGRLSNAAIYGYALSPAQVQSNYASGFGGGTIQGPRYNRFRGFRRI